MYRIAFLFACCWVIPLDALWAQGEVYEKITIEHGLSQGMIFDLCQTQDGFLWAATKDGLNRYDGYNFKVFSHSPFDPYALSENTVTTLFEDSRGLLWIGTYSKRLDVYDRRTGRFHHISQVQEVTSMMEDQKGILWCVSARKELIRITIPDAWKNGLPREADLDARVVINRLPVEDYDPDGERLYELWPKEDGNLLLSSSYRYYEVLADKGLAAPSSPAAPDSESGNAYQNGGNIWQIDNKFQLRHTKNGQTARYFLPEKDSAYRFLLKNDGHNGLWLVFGNRLWMLPPDKTIDLSKPDWTIDQEIISIITDRNGNIWLGTAGYGLRKINPKRQAFHSGLPGKSIWRLWRSPHGHYFWRDISEIYRYDPATGQSAIAFIFQNLTREWKIDFAFEPSGKSWLLGTYRTTRYGFLLELNGDQKPERQFSLPIKTYDYSSLLLDQDGYLWATGAGCNLLRFDPRTTHMEMFSYAHLFNKNAQAVWAYALVQDGNGDLWIGTQQGLVKGALGKSAPKFHLMQTDPGNPQSLNNNSIACILPDPVHPGDALWIGTKGGGINRLDLRSGKFLHIGAADGLPDNVVYGILPGNEDPQTTRPSLWCSTNRGLAKLAFPAAGDGTEKPEITVFSAAKGLQDNEFNTQAFFKTTEGELLFGGVNGMNRFFPEALRPDTASPAIFIVGLEINHQPVKPGSQGSLIAMPVEHLPELRVNHDQNNLSFEFAALDFTDPAQNRYRYRLVGLDADWVNIGHNRFAHFTHLAPGRYTFWVEGSNGESAWRAAQPITVVVRPPWWRSYLAYLIYTALLILGAWRAYRFQVNRLREREQFVFEQRETERVKAMEQVKTNFFNNITHEFRTPLTTLLEPMRQFLQNPKAPDGPDKIRLAERSGQKLLGLVNQLLDMAKLESGSMMLDLRRDDFSKLLRNVLDKFLPLAEKRNQKITLRTEKDIPSVVFDADKVEIVLNNLISNALKFTAEGGRVDVNVIVGKSFNTSDLEKIEVRVSDTGIGIPAEALPKIFDRFYQVDASHTRAGEGTGIGLALSKELAILMGGDISVESQIGQGSTFTFWLPTGTIPDITTFQNLLNSPSDPSDLPVVLVVEDNTDLRQYIKDSIGPAWQVVEASDGAEGIRKAMDLLPDLIISDVMMPQKDGYELCNKLKNNELTAHIPIILLTAKTTLDAKLTGLRTGADDYLTKPFNTEELLVRINNLLEKHRHLRRLYGQGASVAASVESNEKYSLHTAPDREFLRRFTLLVEQHLAEEGIGVEELAQKMSLSRVQLHRKLKALTDQSVSDFVRDYRLDRAMSMLKNQEGSVNEIAARTAFASTKHFARVFKERFGISPSEAGKGA